MSDENKVLLQGEAPFDLGVAQDLKARAVNGGVEMSLFVVIPSLGPLPQQIQVRTTIALALVGAERLRRAAVDAEQKHRD